jgi:hypothetical protein
MAREIILAVFKNDLFIYAPDVSTIMEWLFYFLWLTVSIFVAHWITDITGLEQYAVKNRIGYIPLFLTYTLFLIIFDWLWRLA